MTDGVAERRERNGRKAEASGDDRLTSEPLEDLQQIIGVAGERYGFVAIENIKGLAKYFMA